MLHHSGIDGASCPNFLKTLIANRPYYKHWFLIPEYYRNIVAKELYSPLT